MRDTGHLTDRFLAVAPVTPSLLLASGQYLDLVDPARSAFSIEDIARGLSNTCRFAGQTRQFYSVAQHSLLASRIVPPPFAMQALLHDAAEAFIGDIPSPLKSMLPDYQAIEKRLERAIFDRFGLPETLDVTVKYADLVLLATERRDLMPETADIWPIIRDVPPLPEVIVPAPQPLVEEMFMWRYIELLDDVLETR